MRTRRRAREVDDGPRVGPPVPDDTFDPQVDPSILFRVLDPELPLALLPVRLEARFLPDRDPTELVVRVFCDDLHVDTHDATLTDAERALAQVYWTTVWDAAGDATAAAQAQGWLTDQLGAHRAAYVAAATQPAQDPPTRPGKPPVLATVPGRQETTPGLGRLLPARWAAFVDVGDEVHGPFWAEHAVRADLAAAPALVDLPPDADARDFLTAQGLDWMIDLTAAEDAGMVVRIPVSSVGPPGDAGYDRLLVVGTAVGTEHDETFRALLEAHRSTRGLEVIPPGTPTNTTEQATGDAVLPTADELFAAELERDRARSPAALADPADLYVAGPADAVAVALGLDGHTAVHRSGHADHPQPRLARAANVALWPATWGRWFSDPMRWADDGTPLLSPDALTRSRTWFVDYVRAEGPLPTLLAGRHPYGLLPVTRFGARPDATTTADHVEDLAYRLWVSWLGALDTVPVLDPDAADVAPAGQAAEDASDVGAIVGATPHVRELRLRTVEDTHDDLGDLFSARLGLAGLLCALVPLSDGSVVAVEDLESHAFYSTFLRYEADARGARGVQAQVDALSAMSDGLEDAPGTEAQRAAAQAAADFVKSPIPRPEGLFTGDLFGMAARHKGRVEDATPFLTPLAPRDELGTDHAPLLYCAAFGEEGTEEPVGVLVADGEDDAPAVLSDWLGGVAGSLRAWVDGGSQPSYAHTVAAPLFQQLVQSAAQTVSRGQADATARALERLRDHLDDHGPAGLRDLERLMRATLGLAMYRTDAWLTSIASRRLAEQRTKRRTGLQVGGYGWLVRVRQRAGRASQGHIHAPSLDQATTAAVLRSGWAAFGTQDAGSPLAVDLSSARVRTAKSLLEGVRSGHELGRLLGARLERRLHDSHLDAWVDEVRAAVLRGAGNDGQPPNRVADGLLAARAFTEGIEQTTAEAAVRTELDTLLTRAPAGVQRALVGCARDLDAVADVLLSQSVHALLRGDEAVAAPTLAATGSGDAGLPAINLPATRRGGRLVTHHVIGTFGVPVGGNGWPGAAHSVLAAVEPRLERWVGSLLGPPDRVRVRLTSGGEPVDLSVLDVGALDLVYGVEELRRRVLDAVGAPEGADLVAGRPDGLADDLLTFDELVVLARAVAATLGRLRALAPTDLAAEGRSWDTTDLLARVGAAEARVPPGDARHDALQQHRDEHPGPTAAQAVEQLQILAGVPVPVLPLLPDGVPAPLASSFAARTGEAVRAVGWLAQVAKVRTGVDTFLSACRLAELTSGRLLVSGDLAQSPDAVGDAWIGWADVAEPGARDAWFSVTGPPGSGPLAGFVVDSWTEVIPDRLATTGVAVHIDRPSAQAPNAVLLAVARAGERFDVAGVADCLRHTLLLAQSRAISPDALPGDGQLLPAVVLSSGTRITATGGEPT
ncbi:hypothetical protein [Cellulomonas sp. P5_C5]